MFSVCCLLNQPVNGRKFHVSCQTWWIGQYKLIFGHFRSAFKAWFVISDVTPSNRFISATSARVRLQMIYIIPEDFDLKKNKNMTSVIPEAFDLKRFITISSEKKKSTWNLFHLSILDFWASFWKLCSCLGLLASESPKQFFLGLPLSLVPSSQPSIIILSLQTMAFQMAKLNQFSRFNRLKDIEP